MTILNWSAPKAASSEGSEGKLYKVAVSLKQRLPDASGFYRPRTVYKNVYFFVIDHQVLKSETIDGDYKDVKICTLN